MGDGDGGDGAGSGDGSGASGDGGGGFDFSSYSYNPANNFGWDQGGYNSSPEDNTGEYLDPNDPRRRLMPTNPYGWNMGLHQGLDLDPAWLASAGFKGPVQGMYGTGENSGSGPSQELRDWLGQNNYSFGRSYSGEANNEFLGRLFNAQGGTVGQEHRWSAEDDPGNIFGLAILAASGGFAAPIALGAAGAGVGATAATQGGIQAGAAYGSGGSTSDIIKAGALGAGGAAVGSAVSSVNPGGYVTDSALGQTVINRGITGGINAGIRGDNVLTGAATSAAQAGASGMWDDFMGSFTNQNAGDPYAGGYSPVPAQEGSYQDWRQNMSQQSFPMNSGGTVQYSPDISSYYTGGGGGVAGPRDENYSNEGMATLGNINSAGYVPTASAAAPMGWQEYLKRNGGNIAGALGSLYMGQRQASQMGRARSQLDQLYSPNSPYAQQMRQALQRRDAASGRRTSGTRDVDLAAALTQARSGQLLNPQYQGLMNGQQAGWAQSIGPLLQLYNRGTFNGLGDAASSAYSGISNYFGS